MPPGAQGTADEQRRGERPQDYGATGRQGRLPLAGGQAELVRDTEALAGPAPFSEGGDVEHPDITHIRLPAP